MERQAQVLKGYEICFIIFSRNHEKNVDHNSLKEPNMISTITPVGITTTFILSTPSKTSMFDQTNTTTTTTTNTNTIRKKHQVLLLQIVIQNQQQHQRIKKKI